MSDRKLIALTFDDGPNTDTTPHFLDRLERYGVRATFFVEGQFITEKTIPVMKRAMSLGCLIENHAYTHTNMSDMGEEQIRKELLDTDGLVLLATGRVPKFFRPPYIGLSDTLFASVDKTFICGFNAEDWDPSIETEERAKRILAQAKHGGIILLHDMSGNMKTAEALDTLIPALLEQGYSFVTVEELFREMGTVAEKGQIYTYL
ncbi:MAG: polysaccharide deacetylase family protein [Lachnospiraceae bacterium]|nr:polysaccharide deacetylase family protein [Lachnospiraceae bacterium]